MDQNNHHNHSSNGFGNGFLMGVIVGAAIVFFLFTKRGKQLLKVISEEGIEGIEEFKDLLDSDEEEEAYEDHPAEKVLAKTEEAVSTFKKGAKRFFRGVPKKK